MSAERRVMRLSPHSGRPKVARRLSLAKDSAEQILKRTVDFQVEWFDVSVARFTGGGERKVVPSIRLGYYQSCAGDGQRHE